MNWRILFLDNVKYIELKLKCPKTFFRVLQLGKDCANKETDALSRGIQKKRLRVRKWMLHNTKDHRSTLLNPFENTRQDKWRFRMG